MNSTDFETAVATRIRGIIGGQDHGLIEATARRLGVSEVALRISIHEIQPHPTLEVIVAVVRHYGVDPSWLVSGVYDAATHRKALDEEAALSHDAVARLVTTQVSDGISGIQSLHPNLRLEA
jgi:hypothetical protein